MRAVSRLLALLYLAGHAVAGFLIVFAATFPFENQSPEEAAGDGWLIVVGVGVLIVGLFVTAAIVFLPRLAIAAYAVALLADVLLLAWALGDSHHSDGKLVFWGVAIELAGLAALVTSRHRTAVG
jgi:hypothetical protein